MKLLYCPNCTDVVRLSLHRWRFCACKETGGQYNRDALTATIFGKKAKIFGVANPFFEPDFQTWSPQKRAAIHRKYGYKKTEIWWGGSPGDWQLLWNDKPARLSDKAVEKKVRKICRAAKAPEPRITEIISHLRERRVLVAARTVEARKQRGATRKAIFLESDLKLRIRLLWLSVLLKRRT